MGAPKRAGKNPPPDTSALSAVDRYRSVLEQIKAGRTKKAATEQTTLAVLIDILEALQK